MINSFTKVKLLINRLKLKKIVAANLATDFFFFFEGLYFQENFIGI